MLQAPHAATLAPAADHSIGPTGPLAEKAKGLESQAFVSQWFTKPGEVLVRTIKEESFRDPADQGEGPADLGSPPSWCG